MFKKIFLSITVLLILITGYFLYFTFGKPLLFLDSFKWAVSPRHTRAEAIESVAWFKINDFSKLRTIYPDLGEPLDILILEGKYQIWGGYSDGKTPQAPQNHTGTLYCIRGGSRVLTFSIPQKPDYVKLSTLGSLRRIRLP